MSDEQITPTYFSQHEDFEDGQLVFKCKCNCPHCNGAVDMEDEVPFEDALAYECPFCEGLFEIWEQE